MKKASVIIFFLLQFLNGFSQDCPSLRLELAALQARTNNGVWMGRYNFTEEEIDRLPPHCEVHLGNYLIGDSGEKKNLFTVYGFDKSKYKNFVKLHNWSGYEVNINESFGRVWVIIYHNKVNNSQHHEWCIKMMDHLTNYCQSNTNM